MKKLIAITLICVMLISLLVSCKNPFGDIDQKNPDSSDNSKDNKDNKEENKEDDKDNKEENKEDDQPAEETDPDTELKVGTAVGDLFEDLTLETLDGGSVNTADYRGKIVIINIWATRCPPCKEELPDFNRIADEYEGEVVIIAAHEYYTKSAAPAHVETNFPDSKIIFAYDTPYGDAYYAAGGEVYIPQTAIIDKNGVIIYSDSGILSYERLVAIIEATK